MDEKTMRIMASRDYACTRTGEVPQAVIDGYASRHPIIEGMDARERRVWDSLDDDDRRMIDSDRAFYGTGGSRERKVSFFDVLGIRQFD